MAPDYAQALQPLTSSNGAHREHTSTKILKDLAPQLFHPRIIASNAFAQGSSSASAVASTSSSSSSRIASTSHALELSNPGNAWISLARGLKVVPGSSNDSATSAAKGRQQGLTSTDLRIIEGVDRLLQLAIPPLPSVPEEGDEEDASLDYNADPESAAVNRRIVSLLEGFTATVPSASYRKTARRRRRAGITDQQLGITAGVNELGLRERGDRARGLLADYTVESVESVESTPKRRTIRGRRRTSFMPGAPPPEGANGDGHTPAPELTRPELESEIKEIGLDKDALRVRRKLVLKDLDELEEKIRKLEDVREELGARLLHLKEEELELDDELVGVQDRLADLDARSAGRIVSGASSRRRRGPAFLPSEHDDLPPNVAFMTLAVNSTPSASMYGHPHASSPAMASITALDFSEPYGTLVSAYSEPDKGVRIWDLTIGEQVADLQGHRGIVKCLLVEGNLCITGGEDGKIVLWDLPSAIEDGLSEEGMNGSTARDRSGFVGSASSSSLVDRGADAEQDDPFFSSSGNQNPRQRSKAAGQGDDDGDNDDIFSGPSTTDDGFSKAKLRILEGHSKDVTCLSYEDSSLVSGSSDKTLRLWDLNTGQCVVTMDILWAISNPLPVEIEDMHPQSNLQPDFASGNRRHTMGGPTVASGGFLSPSAATNAIPSSPAKMVDGEYPWHASPSAAYMTPNRKRTSLSGLRRLSSHYGNLSSLASPTTPTGQLSTFSFAQATPPYSDGSWEMYSDFVGGLQLWSYALASGSADGCVRMWDTRTGQSVRSLIGHTSAVTSLQFDNTHLISGSLDKSVRIWDLRTGKTLETLKYEGPVTDVSFDSRRILVAGGTNGIHVFNRTTLQQTELVVNGHTSPAERLRFMDKYLATGGKDSVVKIWNLA